MAIDYAAVSTAIDQAGLGGLGTMLPVMGARPVGYVLMHPIFGRFGVQSGFIRGAVMVAMLIPVLPMAIAQLQADPSAFAPARLPLAVLRELAIGALLGIICGLPFWAAQAAGDFIDQQRGAAMASIIDPGSGGEVSVTGTLLMLCCLLVLTASGALLPALFGPLMNSYAAFPVFTPLDTMPERGQLVLGLLDQLLRAGITLALPVIVPLLLIEFAIAVATKYMPSINGTFLAMSVKQAVHVVLLLVYAVILASYAVGVVGTGPFGPEALRAFVDPGPAPAPAP